jgi:anti-sigma-K factor RskA
MYDDDQDALAAEYVLGTLSAEEREQAESLLTLDAEFAEIVRVWEHRLGELNVMVEAVEPPADLWDKVRAEIDSARGEETEVTDAAAPSAAAVAEGEPQSQPVSAAASEAAPDEPPEPGFDLVPDLLSEGTQDLETGDRPKDFDSSEHPTRELDETSLVDALASTLLPRASQPTPAATSKFDGLLPPAPTAVAPPEGDADGDLIALRSDLRRWRVLALALGAVAAVLAGYVGFSRLAPGPGGQSLPALAASKGPSGTRLVAVLQQEPTSPAFLLTLDSEQRTVTVRRLTAAPDSGHAYALWLFSSKLQKPASLGPVGAEEFTSRPIPSNLDVETMRSATYGISLEPAGGSQSGAPNGPMLFRGRMVEALPGPPD